MLVFSFKEQGFQNTFKFLIFTTGFIYDSMFNFRVNLHWFNFICTTTTFNTSFTTSGDIYFVICHTGYTG